MMIFVLQKGFSILFELLELLIFIDIILSWVYRGENEFTRIVHIFTEPFLAPGRKIQDKIIPGLPIDLSPILALFIIHVLKIIINTVLVVLMYNIV